MQSMRGRLRLTRSLVAGSLVALGVVGVLAGCQRKEADAPELPVQTVSGFLEIAGVLDRRGEQGAVFEVSPETGDLVAFVFDPKSALGQRLCRSVCGTCLVWWREYVLGRWMGRHRPRRSSPSWASVCRLPPGWE